MRSTSGMPDLSPIEDLLRRVSEAGERKLRLGQEEALTKVSDNPEQPIFNFVLPTGYGKSVTGLGAFDILKQQGRANRLLIVVPTGVQKDQYVDDLAGSISTYGLDILVPKALEDRNKLKLDGSHVGLRLHQQNMSEVFVATIQHVQRNGGFYTDLMCTGRWAVFADEYHKLNAEAEWGKSAKGLNACVMIGMTATPIRTDGKPTIFMGHASDVTVSFEQAFKEEAIRGVVAHVEHYFVDIEERDENGEVVVSRKTTEELDGSKESRGLRYLTKYCASILSSAFDCLCSLELQHKDQHQMLVFAIDVQHAKNVSNLLNDLFGPDFSDWVGTGDFGRSIKDNDDILKRYKSGTSLKCLVQVGMATEGFDNPQSSVLVFLNVPSRMDVVSNYQGAGRGVRRNFGIQKFSQDVCHMFASPDSPMADVIAALANRTIGAFQPLPAPTHSEGDGREPPLYLVPPAQSFIADTEFDRSEIIANIPEEKVLAQVEHYKNRPNAPAADENTIKAFMREMLAEQEIQRRREIIRKAEEEANSMENWQDRVKKACNTLAGNIVRLRFGDSHPKSARGDAIRQVHTYWLRATGKSHEAMTSEEFKLKYEWVEKANTALCQTRKLPTWVSL